MKILSLIGSSSNICWWSEWITCNSFYWWRRESERMLEEKWLASIPMGCKRNNHSFPQVNLFIIHLLSFIILKYLIVHVNHLAHYHFSFFPCDYFGQHNLIRSRVLSNIILYAFIQIEISRVRSSQAFFCVFLIKCTVNAIIVSCYNAINYIFFYNSLQT